MVMVGIPYFSLHDANHTVSEDELAPLRRIAGRRRKPRGKLKTFEPGTIVRLSEGAYEGLRGTVVRTEGKMTVVDFGAKFFVPKIFTWLLTTEVDDDSACNVNGSKPEQDRSAA